MTTECKASSSEEPGAGIPHAGICAGGARQRASLPRYPVQITQSSNVPFRLASGCPALAKLILPSTYLRLNFDKEIFGGQSKLSEIEPAPLPDDMTSSYGSTLTFGGIPYQGDVYLRTLAAKSIGNCGIQFTHRGTQNIYFGKQPMTFYETSFSWSYANYRLWFENFPTVASGRNWSGDYRFFVQAPRGDPDWEAYLAANARAFLVVDQAAFAARFPEDAAAGNWPKFVFTSGFFSGTWAKYHGSIETVILVR